MAINKYELERQQALEQLQRQRMARQRYLDFQRAKEERAYQREQKEAKLAEPGNRQIDWAGKGLAAGGPWGALGGASSALAVNMYDASQHGSFFDRVKGVAKASAGLPDLVPALKSKYGSETGNQLAAGAGQEVERKRVARERRSAMSPGMTSNTAFNLDPETQQPKEAAFNFGAKEQELGLESDFQPSYEQMREYEAKKKMGLV